MQMEMFMKVIGISIRLMDSVFISITINLSTLVNGNLINRMEEEKKLGKMAHHMKVIT
jgi:hypothetical protein